MYIMGGGARSGLLLSRTESKMCRLLKTKLVLTGTVLQDFLLKFTLKIVKLIFKCKVSRLTIQNVQKFSPSTKMNNLSKQKKTRKSPQK